MTIKIIKTSGIPGTAASPGEGGGGSQPVQWEEIQGKPDTFRPTIGTTAITAKAGNYTPVYNEIKDRPTSFAPTPATKDKVGGVKMAAAVKDATAAPTAADFNALLKSLRDANILSK